jgi:hypothetical protein
LELGLCLGDWFQGANDLDCRRHHGDEKRFVLRADEKLTAFLELEAAIRRAQSGRPSGKRTQAGSHEVL